MRTVNARLSIARTIITANTAATSDSSLSNSKLTGQRQHPHPGRGDAAAKLPNPMARTSKRPRRFCAEIW